MRLTDIKFRKNAWAYFFQCSLAILTVLIVLVILDSTLQTAIIASIGASSFIVFTAPNAFSAKTRALMGGYAIGIITGIGCSLIAGVIGTHGTAGWDNTVIVMGEQVKSIDFHFRKARLIEKASQYLLAEVLSILDACIY